jgi:hypothetical protein
LGYVAERLVEVYALLGAGGELSSFKPGSDVDHKDYIVDRRGSVRNVYLQVKCATHPDSDGRVVCQANFRGDELLSSPRFLYIFCLLDSKEMELSKIWLVPSQDFNRMATRLKRRTGYLTLQFEAYLGRRSKWARFLVDRSELGARLLGYIDVAPAAGAPSLTGLLILGRSST